MRTDCFFFTVRNRWPEPVSHWEPSFTAFGWGAFQPFFLAANGWLDVSDTGGVFFELLPVIPNRGNSFGGALLEFEDVKYALSVV